MGFYHPLHNRAALPPKSGLAGTNPAMSGGWGGGYGQTPSMNGPGYGGPPPAGGTIHLSNDSNYVPETSNMPTNTNVQGKIHALLPPPPAPLFPTVRDTGARPGVYNGPNSVEQARGYSGPPPQQNDYNPHNSVLAAYNQPVMDKPTPPVTGIGGTVLPNQPPRPVLSGGGTDGTNAAQQPLVRM